MDHTTVTRPTLNARARQNDPKPAWSFTMIEDLLGALPPVEDLWARLPALDAVALFQTREQWLGVATLSWRSISLLHELICALGLPYVIWRHAPSLRAADKQAMLDAMLVQARVWVNKTVTLRLGPMHLLCTGVGDFTLHRGLLTAVAHELRLPKRIVKDCHINPADYSPESELGLLTGMVSPFVSPGMSAHRLHAVILLTETAVGSAQRDQMVAVSLSPFESLLVPFAHFHILTQMYAQRAYPALRWLAIDRRAATPNRAAPSAPRVYPDAGLIPGASTRRGTLRRGGAHPRQNSLTPPPAVRAHDG